MKLTFLGTGTSFGVPQIGCGCAVCRSEDPRDKRTRVGAIVEDAGLRLLLDTPPELRLQLIAAQVDTMEFVRLLRRSAHKRLRVCVLALLRWMLRAQLLNHQRMTLLILCSHRSHSLKSAR